VNKKGKAKAKNSKAALLRGFYVSAIPPNIYFAELMIFYFNLLHL